MEKKLIQEYEKLKGQEAKDVFTRQLLICHEDMRGRMDNMTKLISDVFRTLAGGSSKAPTEKSDIDTMPPSNDAGSEPQPQPSESKPPEQPSPEPEKDSSSKPSDQPTPEPEKDSSSKPRTDIFSGLRNKEINF
ncbi:hypothetical protein [Fowlpox virus]|nr:hypothetical protein [Fowlpox virus]AXY04772.1 hypothetical protein [Fowlpox virus]AXY05031.1 hypothetical protein [Fowlpox virus]